jgi:ribonuclease P/MRP protein subunit POP5
LVRWVRRRYLAIQVRTGEPVEEDDLKEAVWKSVFQLFGEYGASQASLFFVEYNKEKKQAILRCSHRALPLVRASVTCVTSINDKPATLHVLRVSGTLRALCRKC